MSKTSPENITVAHLEESPECFTLRGKLNRETVPDFWPNSLQQLSKAHDKNGPLTIDLAGIDHIDTAGLAWLINLIKDAKKKNIQFSMANPPNTLLNLAKISDVDGFLPLQ